jgi:hypothetical protein
LKLPKIPYWQLLLGPSLAFGLGFLSNALVMAANHGSMPVLLPAGLQLDPDDWIHSVMTSATHLKFLADWIVIRGFGIASPGDFGEWLYEVTFIPALAAWLGLVVRDHNERRF